MSLKALSEVSEWENVSPQIIAVGFHLANCANGKTGLSFPSVEYLARKTSLSHRSIQRILADMETRGLILRKYKFNELGRQKTSNYVFLSAIHDAGRVPPMTPPRGDTHDTLPPDTHDTLPPDTHDTHKQEVVKQEVVKQEKKQEEPFILPADIDPELWEGIMDTRKKLKAQNTPLGIKLFLSSLDKCVAAGFTRNEAISEAIERGWKSVKPEWLKNSGKKQSFADQATESRRANGQAWLDSGTAINSTCERVQ